MNREPIRFKTTHRTKFSEIDPNAHMNTEHYVSYFLEHRMIGLRENLGWDLKTMMKLPFAVYVKRLDVSFIKPVFGDQEFVVTSFVREFVGADANIEITMTDPTGRVLSTCLMIAACIDKTTFKATDWPKETVDLFYSN